ncbi:sorting nexin-8-like [Anticarsia gemmatalis]|uniref:sorting nexin-8-like n=1 Tax=Anticarsia gemmatalis TaxID=129554 RepID=UPI003F76D090
MSSTETVTFEDLEATDVISVELVPERKGLILKHCEYYVSSRRHGTTVTRRYNDFVQLYDVLYAKYPYRAICRLPPKRVVVGGGSARFLLRRRAALQRWLTLVARHPVLAHDADLRIFLCETTVRLEKPKHDEFVLAGTQEENPNDMTIEEMQAAFISEQEQLRLAHLGLDRLSQIIEKVEGRCEAERSDLRELGAGLSALSTPASVDTPKWTTVKRALANAAELADRMGSEDDIELTDDEDTLVTLATEATGAYRSLCARLSRGLHAERAAAAAAPRHALAPQARALRDRHRYALRAALQEGALARAYALRSLEALPALLKSRALAHKRHAELWHDLHHALAGT